MKVTRKEPVTQRTNISKLTYFIFSKLSNIQKLSAAITIVQNFN